MCILLAYFCLHFTTNLYDFQFPIYQKYLTSYVAHVLSQYLFRIKTKNFPRYLNKE